MRIGNPFSSWPEWARWIALIPMIALAFWIWALVGEVLRWILAALLHINPGSLASFITFGRPLYSMWSNTIVDLFRYGYAALFPASFAIFCYVAAPSRTICALITVAATALAGWAAYVNSNDLGLSFSLAIGLALTLGFIAFNFPHRDEDKKETRIL